jgi:hypothetical protein
MLLCFDDDKSGCRGTEGRGELPRFKLGEWRQNERAVYVGLSIVTSYL